MSNVLDLIKSAGTVKRTATLDLGDCDEAFRGAVFDVWVTPTRAHVQALIEWQKAPGTEWGDLDHWLSETWQNLDLDATVAIREHLQETFPAAWQWLYIKTLRTMNEYRESLTKN